MGDKVPREQVLKIVDEVKGQGLFDKLRHDCMADIETMPAFQHLKERVDKSCAQFLARERWHPGLNKTDVRDKLRKEFLRAGFVTKTVKDLVDEKITYEKVRKELFLPIERIVYAQCGLRHPLDQEKSNDKPNLDADQDATKSSENSTAETGPASKRPRADNEASTSSSVKVEVSNQYDLDPLAQSDTPAPADPVPPDEPLGLDTSGNELSVHHHVTQLSPNPLNVALPDQGNRVATPAPLNDQSLRELALESYGVEIESPAHERL